MTFTHKAAIARVFMAISLIPVVAAIGCGDGSDGPPRHKLSGAITFNGEPIPAGSLTLSPDSSQNNSGPGSTAKIAGGKFSTEKGKGIVGGPYQIVVQGYDGIPVEIEGEGTDERGKELFPPYTLQVDLPEEDGTVELNVPASAASGVDSSGNELNP